MGVRVFCAFALLLLSRVTLKMFILFSVLHSAWEGRGRLHVCGNADKVSVLRPYRLRISCSLSRLGAGLGSARHHERRALSFATPSPFAPYRTQRFK